MCRHHYYRYGGDRFFGQGNFANSATPPANITESTERFTLTVYAPGMDKSLIDVGINGDFLVVSADGSVIPSAGEEFRYQEFTGKFRRSFRLNGKVDVDQVSASYENGILVVDLPKSYIEKKVSVN